MACSVEGTPAPHLFNSLLAPMCFCHWGFSFFNGRFGVDKSVTGIFVVGKEPSINVARRGFVND